MSDVIAQRKRRTSSQPIENPGASSGSVVSDVDVRTLSTTFGVLTLVVVILSRLGANWLTILASIAGSTISTLVAVHFLFGTHIVPPAYDRELQENRSLREKISEMDPAWNSNISEKIALIDRNRRDIDSIVDQIGQQIDGFWVPLNFNISRVENREEFILPIDIRHDVEMMILADRGEQEFLEKYLTLSINKTPLNSMYAYTNIRTPRKLEPTVFRAGQHGQTFELKLRRDLDQREREEFRREIDSIRQKINLNNDTFGRISVLLVIRRPILTTGIEEGLPPPGGD